MNIIVKRFITIFLFTIITLSCAAQILQGDNLFLLVSQVKQQYSITMMEGSSVYRTKAGDVLVTLVTVKEGPNMQRVAQVKATRLAGEYLQAATNKSITVYEIVEKDSYVITDDVTENSETKDTQVESDINQGVMESQVHQSEENLSDKVIQTSLTHVAHMSPLTRFVGEGGTWIFAYYIIL